MSCGEAFVPTGSEEERAGRYSAPHPPRQLVPQFDDQTPVCTLCGRCKSVLVFASLEPAVCETCADHEEEQQRGTD